MTFRAGDANGEDYVRRCFRKYGFSTDPSGRYAAMYKPYHAIGLARGMKLRHAVSAHRCLRSNDVAFDADAPAIAFRREMERASAA